MMIVWFWELANQGDKLLSLNPGDSENSFIEPFNGFFKYQLIPSASIFSSF